MKIKTFIVDAFTKEAFRGNPAGVCLPEIPLDVDTMQAVASELNLSETAFVLPVSTEANTFSIRYFTPTVEVPFCGHATLASSKIVLEKLKKDVVHFVTHSNLQLSAKTNGLEITMKFPLYDTVPYEASLDFLSALGVKKATSSHYAKALDMVVIHIDDPAKLQQLQPDFQKLVFAAPQVKEVVVTSPSTTSEFDFYSRCFCPWIGINEDPVTGAAHAVLAKYWSVLLAKKTMNAYQCSKRGGYLKLHVLNETELEVTSAAHIVLEGEITI